MRSALGERDHRRRLGGRIDTSTSPQAEAALAPILAASPRERRVDLPPWSTAAPAGGAFSAPEALADSGSQCVVGNMQPDRRSSKYQVAAGMKIFARRKRQTKYFKIFSAASSKGDSGRSTESTLTHATRKRGGGSSPKTSAGTDG